MRAAGRLTAELPADCFAVVMATGIVSVAARDNGYRVASGVLVVLAGLAFCLLLPAAVVRLAGTGRAFTGDPTEPTRAFAMFSFVAACDVLDARLGAGPLWVVVGLGTVALAGWFFIGPRLAYALRSAGPSKLRAEARGGWLLAAVATQSLALTAAELARGGVGTRPLLMASLCWWVFGLVAYVAVTVLIGRRLSHARLDLGALHPDTWVLMGALAIATVAGSTLLQSSVATGGLLWLPALLSPALVCLWVICTGLIPLLIAGELWRSRRIKPHYERARWATVFPLGMYAVASYALAGVLRTVGGSPGFGAVLRVVSQAFLWVAFIAWFLTVIGLARYGRRWLRRGRS